MHTFAHHHFSTIEERDQAITERGEEKGQKQIKLALQFTCLQLKKSARKECNSKRVLERNQTCSAQ